MADVVEINDLAQLQHYRLAWDSLLSRTSRASFFHTFDWLERFWTHFGRDRNFRILVVRARGKLIGIVPLCVQTETYAVGKLRVLTYPLSDWGFWYGPIGSDQSACLFMAMQHLSETPRDWDLAELRWVDSSHGDRSRTERAMRAAGMTAQESAYRKTSIVEMAEDWEAYLASRTSKFRHETRRQLRKVEELGAVEFVRHRPQSAACGDGDARWEMFEQCQRVAAKSWQGKSVSGNTLSHDRVRDFLRDCHGDAARLGMLDMSLLKIDGSPAAFAYNYHHNGVVAGLRMGFDPDISTRGLGRALLALVLRDSHERGDRVYDLGIGDYDFKRRFRTDVETSYQHTYFPPLAWKSQSLRASRWLKARWTRLDEATPTDKANAG